MRDDLQAKWPVFLGVHDSQIGLGWRRHDDFRQSRTLDQEKYTSDSSWQNLDMTGCYLIGCVLIGLS